MPLAFHAIWCVGLVQLAVAFAKVLSGIFDGHPVEIDAAVLGQFIITILVIVGTRRIVRADEILDESEERSKTPNEQRIVS